MICPLCKYPKSKVENTLKLMTANKRLRQCLNPNCRKYFFTQEIIIDGLVFDESPVDESPEEPDSDEKDPDLFSQN